MGTTLLCEYQTKHVERQLSSIICNYRQHLRLAMFPPPEQKQLNPHYTYCTTPNEYHVAEAHLRVTAPRQHIL